MSDFSMNTNNWEGYGSSPYEDILNLNKALTPNAGTTDIASLSGGSALQPQSLEATKVNLLWGMKEVKLYNDLMKEKAKSTLEEWTVQDGYGQGGGFVADMENPEGGDGDYARKYTQIKFLRTMWYVSDPMSRVQTISPAVSEQQNSAMMRLFRILEPALFSSDSSKISQSFDGWEKQLYDEVGTDGGDNVIDLRGASLSEAYWKQAAEIITANFGSVDGSKAYMSLGALTTQSSYFDSTDYKRYQQNMGTQQDVYMGSSVKGMRTNYGTFVYEPNIFLNVESQEVPKKRNVTTRVLEEGATSAKAPAMPSFTLTANAATVTGSQWASTGNAPAGAYLYRVAAVNQYGSSVAAASQTVTVAASGSVSIVITEGGGTYATQAYDIYRETTPGSGKIRFLTRVAYTASPQTVTDLNADIAGTTKVFLGDMTSNGDFRTMRLSELAPIFSQPYSKVGPYVWGAINYYVAFKLYAPRKTVIFKNVGVASTTTVSAYQYI